MAELTTYSALDTTVVINFPLTGLITCAGVDAKGLNRVEVRMLTERTSVKIGSDGAGVVSAKPGRNGEIQIDVWQTSTFHHELLNAYNAITAAADGGDVSRWASGTLLVTSAVDGSTHNATGVCFKIVPPKVYEAEAQVVAWVLVAVDIISQ